MCRCPKRTQREDRDRESNNDNSDARIAISNATALGTVRPYYYDRIMNNEPLTLPARPAFSAPSN
jgi:hypothetical protein